MTKLTELVKIIKDKQKQTGCSGGDDKSQEGIITTPRGSKKPIIAVIGLAAIAVAALAVYMKKRD